MLDQSGIGKTVCLLVKLIEPQFSGERADHYLQRLHHAFRGLNDYPLELHGFEFHESNVAACLSKANS
jgi:hypothetical protein